MPKTGRPPLPLPIDWIREHAKNGLSLAEMADQLGCSKNAVWHAMKRYGIPRRPQSSCPGERNPNWGGGIVVDKQGYVLVSQKDHPMATAGGYVRQHRLVMERILGRVLTAEEVVHHRDGDVSNNDPMNLQLFDRNGTHLEVTRAGCVPNWSAAGRRRLHAPKSAAHKEKIRQGHLRRQDRLRVATHAMSKTDDPE